MKKFGSGDGDELSSGSKKQEGKWELGKEAQHAARCTLHSARCLARSRAVVWLRCRIDVPGVHHAELHGVL
jgi:hypothetical protein